MTDQEELRAAAQAITDLIEFSECGIVRIPRQLVSNLKTALAPAQPAGGAAGMVVTDEMVERATIVFWGPDDHDDPMRAALEAALALAAAPPPLPADLGGRTRAEWSGERNYDVGVPGYELSPFGVTPREITAWLRQGDSSEVDIRRKAADLIDELCKALATPKMPDLGKPDDKKVYRTNARSRAGAEQGGGRRAGRAPPAG